MDEPTNDVEAPPTRQRRLDPLTAFVTLIALALAAFAWSLQSRVGDLEAERDDRRDVSIVASNLTLALLAYDHADLDVNRETVLNLSSTAFQENYLGAFDDGLATLIESLEATATAEIRQVMVDVTGDRARAIVIADSVVNSAVGSRVLTGSYLDIALVKLDGSWLVESVTSVAATGEDLVPAPGATEVPTGSASEAATPAPSPSPSATR